MGNCGVGELEGGEMVAGGGGATGDGGGGWEVHAIIDGWHWCDRSEKVMEKSRKRECSFLHRKVRVIERGIKEMNT